jgi:hypothetical protein
LNQATLGTTNIQFSKWRHKCGLQDAFRVVWPTCTDQERSLAFLFDDGPQIHEVQIDESHTHQRSNQSFNQVFNPFGSHLPRFAALSRLPCKTLQ